MRSVCLRQTWRSACCRAARRGWVGGSAGTGGNGPCTSPRSRAHSREVERALGRLAVRSAPWTPRRCEPARGGDARGVTGFDAPHGRPPRQRDDARHAESHAGRDGGRLNAYDAAAELVSGHEVTAHVDGQTERDEIDGAEAHMEGRE